MEVTFYKYILIEFEAIVNLMDQIYIYHIK